MSFMYAPQDFHFWNAENENKAHTLIHKTTIVFMIIDTIPWFAYVTLDIQIRILTIPANAQPTIKI